MKTFMANAQNIERRWLLIDAEGQTLGRLATKVAALLRGKHKPEYTPNADTGDYVIVVNADKVVVSGNKETEKMYRRHSGYPGGLKEIPYNEMIVKHPERVLGTAVRGMLPKNSLGRKMYRKLKIYAGPEHPHEAQKPEKIEI